MGGGSVLTSCDKALYARNKSSRRSREPGSCGSAKAWHSNEHREMASLVSRTSRVCALPLSSRKPVSAGSFAARMGSAAVRSVANDVDADVNEDESLS